MIYQKLGSTDLDVSRIALGCMSLAGTWNPAEIGPENVRKAIATFEASVESGITFYDHADIYGGTSCETLFKDCLSANPGIREKIVVATKCGIRSGHYNLSASHIEKSIEGSLTRMGIDYVDLYQMHRPDPLSHPRETAGALRRLVERGLVRHVGVSNYYPEQVRALQTYLEDIPIVSNQISISLLRLDPIYEGWDGGDGSLDQCEAMNMSPLAYSPLGGSTLAKTTPIADDNPRKSIIDAVRAELAVQAEKYDSSPGNIAIAWLLAHPSGIVPLVGSNNPAHVVTASQSADVVLGREDWYKLWTAAWGRPVP